MEKGAQPAIIIIKKKGHGHGHHGGGWKVALADFMTAMMAFFLLLWLLGSTSKEEQKAISGYFNDPGSEYAIGEGGANPGVIDMEQPQKESDTEDPIVKNQNAKDNTKDNTQASMTEDVLKKELERIEQEQLEALREQMDDQIEQNPVFQEIKDQIIIDFTALGLRIQIVDKDKRPMFDSGSAHLKNYSEAVLNALGPLLDKVPNKISVGETNSMITALTNCKIFNGEQWLTKHAVIFEGEKIIAVCSENNLPGNIAQSEDLNGQCLIPGLIDTQVNGGGGVLFNDAPTIDTLRTIGTAHRQFGTTGFYPTLISDDLEVVQRAIVAVAQAMAEKVPGVLGIHLEGPFLNPQRKGVHNASKFKTIDESAFHLLTSLKVGKTLITIAPELTTPEMIARLAAAGVVVAAGHSAATFAQTTRALEAGLSSFTHLFNAMTPLTSREPGMVGAALQDQHSWCGIIVDGHHVHPATLQIALKIKAKQKMVLVTDAMPSVGAKEKSFMLNGELIHCSNGCLTTADGTLAGSDLNMLAAIKNSIEKVGVERDEAIRMASLYPATMMGIADSMGKIETGYNASMILIDKDFNLLRSWIDGKESHQQ